MTSALFQFGGSLLAILMLAWIASRLKLGGDCLIQDRAAAKRIADEVSSGFEPVAFAIDRGKQAALMRDANAQIMVVRRHGSHFVGRILGPAASATEEDGRLCITTGERPFGEVWLDIHDPPVWACAINTVE